MKEEKKAMDILSEIDRERVEFGEEGSSEITSLRWEVSERNKEIEHLKSELERYSKIIDMKEQWALQNEKQRDEAQKKFNDFANDVKKWINAYINMRPSFGELGQLREILDKHGVLDERFQKK